MEPNTTWKFKTKQLAQKNNHGVPLYKIKEMMERYEKNINLESLLLQWNLPDIKKEEYEETGGQAKCQNHDLPERSSDPFKMEEIAQEVSELDQNLNEDKSTVTFNSGIGSSSDGVSQEDGDEKTSKSEHLKENKQRMAEAFSGEEKLVDYPDSSDSEGEELFMSDDSDDSELKDTGNSDQTELNPCVPEFVPLASRENSPLTLPYLLEEGKEDWSKVATDWKEGVGGLLRGLREEAGQVGYNYLRYIPPKKKIIRQDHLHLA